MQVQGKLYAKFDTQQIKETFKKREFVLEYIEGNPMYPQYVLFQLIQDRCNLIDNIEKGADITVEFNLRGREWTSPQGEKKYFNSLDAWRITLGNQQSTTQDMGPGSATMESPAAMDVTDMSDSDDLPF